jgi:hypothetical protein
MAKRYQRGNQKALIEVGQTIQLPKDIKGVIRRHKFMPSDYPFGICWPLYRLSYFDLCLLITHLETIQWPTYNKGVIGRHTLK